MGRPRGTKGQESKFIRVLRRLRETGTQTGEQLILYFHPIPSRFDRGNVATLVKGMIANGFVHVESDVDFKAGKYSITEKGCVFLADPFPVKPVERGEGGGRPRTRLVVDVIDFCKTPRYGKEIIDHFKLAKAGKFRSLLNRYIKDNFVGGKQKYPLLKEVKRGVDFAGTIFQTVYSP